MIWLVGQGKKWLRKNILWNISTIMQKQEMEDVYLKSISITAAWLRIYIFVLRILIPVFFFIIYAFKSHSIKSAQAVWQKPFPLPMSLQNISEGQEHKSDILQGIEFSGMEPSSSKHKAGLLYAGTHI